MVIPGEDQHTPVARRTGQVSMLERVARAIDAWALSIPGAKDAIEFRALEEAQLLRTVDRRGGELLVDAGLEDDLVGLEVPASAPQRHVQTAKR